MTARVKVIARRRTTLKERLYFPAILHGMAGLQIRAHLDKLVTDGRVRELGGDEFSLA